MKFLLGLLFFIITITLAEANLSYYQQSVYQERYSNLITQGQLKKTWKKKEHDIYTGLVFDVDNKSNKKTTYTDQQISPLLGIQSKVKFNTRLFLEGRDVNRIGKFADNRTTKSNDFRFGFVGYNKFLIKNFHINNLFNEYYYASFYSSLYKDKIILQAWHKHGINYKNVDILNELFIDSFDISKNEQFTFDLRPGLRYSKRFSNFSIQILAQHFIPIDNSGRENESRATFVFYIEI